MVFRRISQFLSQSCLGSRFYRMTLLAESGRLDQETPNLGESESVLLRTVTGGAQEVVSPKIASSSDLMGT